MKQGFMRRKKYLLVGVAALVFIMLAIILCSNQKHAAIAYLTSQGCNGISYAATAGDTPCSSGSGIAIKELFMDIGVHYSYQTLGGGDGLSVGVSPVCEGGGEPPIYSGDIISILGMHFVFNSKITIPPTPTEGIAC